MKILQKDMKRIDDSLSNRGEFGNFEGKEEMSTEHLICCLKIVEN